MSLHLYRKQNLSCLAISPHEIYIEFIRRTSFDVSFLTDFITDTEFFIYFYQYLKELNFSPDSFINICKEYDNNCLNKTVNFFKSLNNFLKTGTQKKMFSVNIQPILKQLCYFVEYIDDSKIS